MFEERKMDMENFGSALDKKASEMTVVDVYDIAAVVGQEFEWMIDRYGCDALLRLMPKVVRVLELLEVLVSRSAVSPEAEELRQERDRLRRERDDRQDQERRRQQVGDPETPGDPIQRGYWKPPETPTYIQP